MCSNYKFPAKSQLRLLDVNVDQFDIELKARQAKHLHHFTNNFSNFYQCNYLPGSLF